MNTLLSSVMSERRRQLKAMCGSDGTFWFDGSPVFGKFFKAAFHFSHYLQAALRAGSAGASSDAISGTGHSNTPSHISRHKAAHRRDGIVSFLERITDDSGEKIPDRQERYLPFFRKRDLYTQFLDEYELLYNDDPPKQHYFLPT